MGGTSRLRSRLIDDVRTATPDILGAEDAIKIMCLGDSMTWGSGAMGYRRAFWRRLRATRGNVRGIGTVRQGYYPPDGNTFDATSDWLCEGHTGYKIEELDAGRLADSNTGYPGWVALAGVPDVVIDLSGTNNLSQADTAAQMLVKRAALLTTIKTTTPGAIVFVSSIATVGPGYGGGYGTLATKAADYNAGLAALVAAMGPNFVYVNAGGALNLGDLSSDGVHPTAQGYAKLGELLADAVDKVLPRAGRTCPRAFRKRAASPAVSLAATQYVSVTDAALTPDDTLNWYAALTVYPTALSGLTSLLSYGTAYSNGYLLATNGSLITMYVGSGAPKLNGVECKLLVNKRYRVLVHADVSQRLLSLWINGVLRYTVACAAWASTASHITRVGYNGGNGINCVTGLYERFEFGKGASVPGLDDLRDYAEADYFEGVGIPGMTAGYALNEGSGTSFAGYSQLATAAGTTAGVSWSAAGTVAADWDE